MSTGVLGVQMFPSDTGVLGVQVFPNQYRCSWCSGVPQ